MPRVATQNARPALRRLPTRPSWMVQAVISRLLPLLFRSQGLELSHRDAAEGLGKAEDHFALRAVGNLQERCRRIE